MGKFVTQYHEELVAESSVLVDDDGVMMTEDRYCIEMAKPEHGGLSATVAKAKYQDLTNAPEAVKDTKEGKDRVRVALDTHVRFQNKIARRKSVVCSEAPKKITSEAELERVRARTLKNHDAMGDLRAMGSAMLGGIGSQAEAFDG
eukprot:6058938-Alexandrium_andersonii.AAC.1